MWLGKICMKSRDLKRYSTKNLATRNIRVDTTGDFASVKDAIAVINQCNKSSAQQRIYYLRAETIIYGP
jgi:hypothetical protein